MNIRIGTRGSQLALWQADYVAARLRNSGLNTEIVIIQTKGDQILDTSIAKIGSKGVFTEELEQALITGQIDIAVHSAKDMPSQLPDPLELVAFTSREKVNDVLISLQPVDLKAGIRIGTASTRRTALIKHYYPHCSVIPVRGNLQTRMQKLNEGICDALILAYAGVKRMNYDHHIQHLFDIQSFVPAAAQGSIAVECAGSLDNDKKMMIISSVNHSETERNIRAERQFLHCLDGGCSIPVFVHAESHQDTMDIIGGIISLDGVHLIQKKISGSVQEGENLGLQLAKEVLQAGGDRILQSIKKQI